MSAAAAAPGSQLYAAVSALFSPTTTEAQKQEANRWLEQYSRHQDSWNGCRTVLEQSWHASGNVQLAFFIMNLLYQKTKREASTLSGDATRAIQSWLGNAAIAVAQGNLSMNQSVALRLCETLAASAALAPAGGVSSLVAQSMSLLSGQPPKESALHIAIELLRVLPLEIEQAVVKSARLQELTAEMSSQLAKVVGVVTTMLLQQGSPCFLGTIQNERLCIATLKCVAAWVPAGMSLSSLASAPGNLLQALITAVVQCPNVTVVEAVCDTLVAVMTVKTQAQSLAQQQHGMASTVITAVLGSRKRYLEASRTLAGEDYGTGEDLCRAVCSLATATGVAFVDVVARGQEECFVRLVEFISECTSCPARTVAVLSQDFWNALSECPIQNRHPQFRQPLYINLMGTLLKQCLYSGEVSPGNVDGIDFKDDEFGAFRQDSPVKELLESTYYLLGSDYFKVVMGYMTAAGADWHQRESGMWAIKAVSRVFAEQYRKVAAQNRRRSASATAAAASALSPGNASGASGALNPVEIDNMAKSSALMTQLLHALASNANQFRHPILARTTAQTLASLSSWIHISSNALRLVRASTSYLVGSLTVPGASHDVSQALQRLLGKCGKWINDPAIVADLLKSVNASMGMLDIEDQIILVDGLAMFVATMAPQDARGGMEMICGPILERISAALYELQKQTRQSAMGSASMASENANIENALAGGLRSFSCVVKHLDSFNRSKFVAINRKNLQIVAGGIMQKAWPVVSTIVSEAGKLSTVVVDSLFEVLRHLVKAISPLMGQYIGPIVEAAVNAFCRNLSGSALSCLVDVADTFGKEQAAVLGRALQQLYGPSAKAFSGGVAVLAAKTDTVVDFFKLIHILGIRSPGALGTTTLKWLIPMATSCVSANEFKAAKQVAQVLVMLLKTSPANASDLSGGVDRVLASNGNGTRLAQTLLAAIAQNAPERLVSQHSDVLYYLSQRYPQKCQEWVFNFLSPVPEATLSSQVKGKIMELMFSGHVGVPPARSKRRFKGVLEDVSKICRGQQSANILLEYEPLSRPSPKQQVEVIDLSL